MTHGIKTQPQLIAAIVVLLGLIGSLSGCAWVKLTEKGRGVEVSDLASVGNCEELGTTRVSLMDKIVGIDRNRGKVQIELETLARNSAAKIGGDTIVPVTQADQGEQTFAVYRCH